MTDSPSPAPTTPAAGGFEAMALGLEARIAAARVATWPFPHIVLDDVLPAPLRQMLDTYWPDGDELRVSNSMRRAERRVSALEERAAGRERRFWTTTRMLATRLARAARARLDGHLGAKFRPLLGPGWRRRLGTAGYLDEDAMIASYRGAIELPIHVDHARIVVNGFVYLDDGDGAACRGTMLYRSLGLAWPSNLAIPKELCRRFLREAEEVAWRDNRLLLYVNGPWSFHGVPAHDLGAGRRRLLMFGSLLDMAAREDLLDPEIR